MWKAESSWKQDPVVAGAPKKVACRYYQLKIGHAAIGTYLRRIGVQETETCQWCSALRKFVRNWRKERKRTYETWSRNKVLTPRPLEGAPEIRIFGMKEASKRLLQFLGETQVRLASNEASAQAERERRESEWEMEDLDQEEGE
jgi:hypothetical protein